MSNCEKIKEQLWNIAELEYNEVPAQVKEHLENCADCSAELEEIKKIKADLYSLHEEAPDELAKNVMKRVKKEPRRITSLNRIVKICAASAAAVLVCVFTVYNFMLFDQKNGDMMAPEAEDRVNSSNSLGSVADKSEAELPDTTYSKSPEEDLPSIPFGRFDELLEFDFSDCQYSGTFPDDVSVLYFVGENYTDEIELLLGDYFNAEIPDRALYIGKSDSDNITKLDEMCDVKYTRATFNPIEYFAVIIIKE